MDKSVLKKLDGFLNALMLDEEPMGIYFTDKKPEHGFSPKFLEEPSRKKEEENNINWQEVFGNFSCSIGHIWRARKKKTAAWFSKNHYGCPGAYFWLGFGKPQTKTIINYVSSGIPGFMEGEFYCESPEELEKIFLDIDPVPAPNEYLVFKPLSQFESNETPLLVSFFMRPESLCGIHQLATFATNDPEIVISPWSAACGSLCAWPMKYLNEGRKKAVLGGWDPSARKFFKTDELSFTVSFVFFMEMLDKFENSFLKTDTWKIVQKKIEKSKKAWNEVKP
jgi:hypothetical protein